MTIPTKCILSCLLASFLACSSVSAQEKALIGETAWIKVGDIPSPYLARIDTGARITSLHAQHIIIKDNSAVPVRNIGKTISFQTSDRKGNIQQMRAVITEVSTVKNSQGTEQRYVIELPLAWRDVKKNVAVNLRDRSKMTYKLLIGRNWLSSDFLVDVDKKAPKKLNDTH